MSVYLQHCEPSSGCKNLGFKVFPLQVEHDENVEREGNAQKTK